MRKQETQGSQEAQNSQVYQERAEGCNVCKGREPSRRMQNCDGCILWIEFSNMVVSGEWTSSGPEGIIEPSDVVVVGTSKREWRRLLRRWWGGVFPDSAISQPTPTSCSSHAEACNALGATDGTTL